MRFHSLGCELAMWTPNWFPIWCSYMYSESFVIKFIDILLLTCDLFKKRYYGRDIILVQILFTMTNTCRHLIIPRKYNQIQATVMAIICTTFLKELHGFIKEIVLLYLRDKQEYLNGSKLILQKFSQAYAIWFVPPQKIIFINCNVDEIWLLFVIWVLWFFICHTLSLVTWSQVKAARGRKYCVYRDNKD